MLITGGSGLRGSYITELLKGEFDTVVTDIEYFKEQHPWFVAFLSVRSIAFSQVCNR
jgi:hypothetical protein